MALRVHHLNAGTMCPVSPLLVNGRGWPFGRARLVCHVLLIETEDGLTLVDTGMGLKDCADPNRLGPGFIKRAAPKLDPQETAARQVEALGYKIGDVRHILLTHLDRDHAGGLADFPNAKVHVHAREHKAAVTHEIASRPGRYLERQWSDGTAWVLYGPEGDDWFGFKSVRALGNSPDVLMIPLAGHTEGHVGIAVREGGRWLLHAGDAYYSSRQLARRPSVPLGLGYFQKAADANRANRIANQERLRQLNLGHGREVSIICSHDPYEFDACCAAHRQQA